MRLIMLARFHTSYYRRAPGKVLETLRGATMQEKSESKYTISEAHHSFERRLRIIHVGAGASGLLTAYKARWMLENYELICYEK
jgi:hypothetical protein